MTVADEVLRALRDSTAGMTDAELASALGKRHQQINQTCHGLAKRGLIIRDSSRGQIINRVSGTALPVRKTPNVAAHQEANWAWEGNIQSRVVTHLARTGWNIIAVANTAQRERGMDIIAEWNGQQLLVEVKGWPGTTYLRGERVGQPKPTQPSTQAKTWFAEGIASLIRHGGAPGTRLALALPDMPRYRNLLGEVAWALGRLEVTVYLVTAEGAVQEWEREN